MQLLIDKFFGSCLVRRFCSVVLVALIAGCAKEDTAKQDVFSPSLAARKANAINTSPRIADFAVYGKNSVKVGDRAQVNGGDIGVAQAGYGPFLQNGYELGFSHTSRSDTSHSVIANRVYLANNEVVVGDVQTNQLTANGATHGSVSSWVDMPDFPVAHPVSPGSENVTVWSGSSRTINEGRYGEFTVGGVITLTGGVVEMSKLTVYADGRIQVLAPTEIRVSGKVSIGDRAYIGPAQGTALVAGNLRIESSGRNGWQGGLNEWPRAVTLGNDASIRATFLAPNGTIALGHRTILTGVLVGRDVLVGNDSTLNFESGLCVPEDCDTGNPCTEGICSLGTCASVNLAAGTSCTDENVCNGEETCDGAGTCVPGAPPILDDENPCTEDICDPDSGVSHPPAPVGTSCADDNVCDGEELCDLMANCTPGAPPVLDDENSCTVDSCDPGQGVSHDPVPVGTSCADNNPCNGDETCDAGGICSPGTPIVVDDQNPCTQDGCDSSGVFHTPVPAGTSCADGNICNGYETCDGAANCTPGTPPNVNDGNPCTADECDSVTNEIVHNPLPYGTYCTNGNPDDGEEICDGEANCIPQPDECLGNPDKMTPGECGCAVLDIDNDGDGTPNCNDECPNDPGKIKRGIADCGQPDDLDNDGDCVSDWVDPDVTSADQEASQICAGAPDGTPCDDAVCAGEFTCNNGRCGNPEDCMPDCGGDCQFVSPEINGERRTYLFCDCEVTWEEALDYCAEDGNRQLVALESAREHAVVSSLMSSACIDMEAAWMGANDLSTEGNWKWARGDSPDGRLFWVGDEDGTRRFAEVIRWSSGDPSGGDAQNCGLMHQQAGWYDAPCSDNRGFICEAPGQGERMSVTKRHMGLPDVEFDTDSCDEKPEFNEAAYWADEAKIVACSTAEPTEFYDSDCHLTVVGDAPDANAPECDPFPDDADADLPNENNPYQISSQQDCVLSYAADFRQEPCERHDDCGANYCGKVGYCCDPVGGDCTGGWSTTNCALEPDLEGRDEMCDALFPGTRCVVKQVCGYATGDQEECFDDWPELPCESANYCEPMDEISVDTESPGLALEPLDLAEKFPYREGFDLVSLDTETAVPDVDSEPCPSFVDTNGVFNPGRDADGNCISGDNHKWCHLESPETPVDKSITFNEEAVAQGRSSTNSAKIVDFDFKPFFDWDYGIESGPLGIPEPRLEASTGVNAIAIMEGLFGGPDRDVDLIDVMLSVRLGLIPELLQNGGLCGFDTRGEGGQQSVAKILTLDFLPNDFKEAEFPHEDIQQQCIDAYSKFKILADTLKKSMRDAEDMLRQYHSAVDQGTTLGTICDDSFETNLAKHDSYKDNPGYFYVDFPPFDPNTPEVACGENELPEVTINRFVDYYNAVMQRVKDEVRIMADTYFTATNVPKDRRETIDIVDVGDEKEITLFNNTFMVGPVPCNLEVFLSMAYGFKLGAYVEFNPASVLLTLFDATDNSPDGGTIAKVGIEGEPYLAARVGLFVGVGFDVGIAAAKVGINGVVSLAEITLPANAAVGLGMSTTPDDRELPPRVQEAFGPYPMENQYHIFPRKIHLNFIMDFGIGVQFSDILSGEIGLRVKLKFAFFSKQWKQRIVKWTGFCSDGNEQGWCNINLLKYGSSTEFGTVEPPWAIIKLDVPFPLYPRIPEDDWVTDIDPSVEKVDYSRSESENLFHESLCRRGPV